MEDPENEVRTVIHLLTQTQPSKQRDVIEKYFTPDAAFIHPLCRTGRFSRSRLLVLGIYRWYKIMSPRIDLKVNSIAFDKSNLILYAHISQVFRIWLFPFYKAPVDLVTVLQLVQDERSGKYFIRTQNDLYQTDQFVRFVWPISFVFVWILQILGMLFSLLGTLIFWPVTAVEEYVLPSVSDRFA